MSKAVDCTQCANCCAVISPVFRRDDIRRLARRLELTPEEFKRRHLRSDEDGLVFVQRPCPFLETKRCTVYEDRPGDCRSYPHLHKKDRLACLLGVVGNADICPIVYEVLERVGLEVADHESSPSGVDDIPF